MPAINAKKMMSWSHNTGRRLQKRKINSYQGMYRMGEQVPRPQLYYHPNACQYRQVRGKTTCFANIGRLEAKPHVCFRDHVKRSSASCQVAEAFLSHVDDVAPADLSPSREINLNLQQVP